MLRKLGELLRLEPRTVDVVARYGGEEFTIILSDTDLEGGTVFAERLRERVAGYDFSEGGDELYITVSIGVATFEGDAQMTAESMIQQADTALYRAKEGGRNMVHH